MGQNEVYDYLIKRRHEGRHEYISLRQLYDALLDMKTANRESRRSVWRSIRQLRKYGCVEIEGIGQFPCYIRAKLPNGKN